MPTTPRELSVVRLSSTVRFVQGYRYLDRCGDALVRLENALDEGWIPGEAAPKGGRLHNWRLGMTAYFQSESMTVHQTEYLSFDHFQDQTCKLYDILWKTFEIEKVLSPTLQVILQIGFEELPEANKYALTLELCEPVSEIGGLLGGEKSAVDFTICTESDVVRDDHPVVQRRRLAFQVVRQERQPDFDDRIMRRLPLLPPGQEKALGDLMRLRRRYPRLKPAAVQFDLENASEGELLTRTFDLGSFLADSWEWAERLRGEIDVLRQQKGSGEAGNV